MKWVFACFQLAGAEFVHPLSYGDTEISNRDKPTIVEKCQNTHCARVSNDVTNGRFAPSQRDLQTLNGKDSAL
jgi:hypothetical protein